MVPQQEERHHKVSATIVNDNAINEGFRLIQHLLVAHT
jgi:hypothetical protein